MATELPKVYETSILESQFIQYPTIDWQLLGQASEHFRKQGYIYKETPWIVPESYNKLTKPHGDRSFVHTHGLFEQQSQEPVGSAEQGFIYLLINKLITPGKYFSVSPCFRIEQYDTTHLPWFIKLELFVYTQDDPYQALKDTIHDSLTYFNQISQKECEVISLYDDTYDINLNNIELGSYGIRTVQNYKFIYGTGLALPRFSTANI